MSGIGAFHSFRDECSPVLLSDDALVARLAVLASKERAATTELILALGEFDRRKLYLGQGCSSLFTYCTQVLHLSEHAAYNRIEAARTAARFPVVIDALEDGSLTLTAVRLLSPILTAVNHARLLGEAKYKCKRDIERLVAAERPQPDVPDTVRKHPQTRILPAPPVERSGGTMAAPPRSVDRLQTPRAALWKRDAGRCAFVGSGGRCMEEAFLEFHHVVPYADGGPATTTNIELRCRSHNAYEAAEHFGVLPLGEQ